MELKSEALFVRVCCKRKEKKKEKDNRSREVVTALESLFRAAATHLELERSAVERWSYE